LTVQNNNIYANSQGIFTNSRGNTPVDFSANTIVRNNYIYGNGTSGDTEHNVYLQSYRALYEGNYIGSTKNGSSIKDRSSGTVIRYNRIVAGARALDLVESEIANDAHGVVRNDSLYNTAWVYGNTIRNSTSEAGYSTRLIHWGFDNDAAHSRAGTLYFYNNTISNKSAKSKVYYTTMFQMNQGIPASANIEARSNVFLNYGDTDFQMISEAGKVNMVGTNFLPQGWSTTHQQGVTGTVNVEGSTVLTGANPSLAEGFVPTGGSGEILNKGIAVTPVGSNKDAASANLQVTHEYNVKGGVQSRTAAGQPDIGAFEQK
jgi:hypothetical protein